LSVAGRVAFLALNIASMLSVMALTSSSMAGSVVLDPGKTR